MRSLRPSVLLGVWWLASAATAQDWPNWRGPHQDGTSTLSHLPSKWRSGGRNDLWSYPLKSRGTPVIDAQGRLFVMGYQGEGAAVRERLVALEAETGKLVWEHVFNDFLSDVVYDRYAIGAPAIDRVTGNVYATSAAGLFTAFSRDGAVLWQLSAMETLGRMTFTNARNGAPVIFGDLVIVHWMTANWGGQSAPRDRFYAFDKVSGALVWSATPGGEVAPRDNSFSTPVIDHIGDRAVLFSGTGDGHVVCIDAHTGETLWIRRISQGGVNASVLVDEERMIAVHGTENLDESSAGRMVALSRDGTRELWRLPISSFSSSPVLAGGRVYQVDDTGELWAVEAATGRVAWSLKLARDQIHGSPLFADGRLYVPLNDGTFQIVEPRDHRGRVISVTKLGGHALGAPVPSAGKVFVTTTERLHAFGARGAARPSHVAFDVKPASKPAKALQTRPSEVWLKPGETMPLMTRVLDEDGRDLGAATEVRFEPWVPPTAKVRSFMDASIDATGLLTAGQPSAGAWLVKSGALTTTLRGRVLPMPPFAEDFESFELSETGPDGTRFAFPPLFWIGGRGAWEVRDLGGAKVLAKTLAPVVMQRAKTFIGHADARSYTISADVMSDGNRRVMSDVGLINQRYIVALKGNWQQLEVSSNDERLKVGVPFKWRPNEWHRLVVRVEPGANGTTLIRAKAWKRDEPEPSAWTLEVPHEQGHDRGAPGVYAFAPDGLFRAYLDRLEIKGNAP